MATTNGILTLVVASMLQLQTAMAGESIVGMWRPQGGACTPTEGAIVIGPKSLTMDEYACTFDDVRRRGTTVTWTGQCGAPDDRPTRSMVVARLSEGRLTITENGSPFEAPYERCQEGGKRSETGSASKAVGSGSRTVASAYVGDFVTECLPGVTCLVKIRVTDGVGYSFDWSATDRSQDGAVCHHMATMTIGTGRHEDQRIENVLHGRIHRTGTEALVSPAGPDKVWIYLNGTPCGGRGGTGMLDRLSMNGVYERR